MTADIPQPKPRPAARAAGRRPAAAAQKKPRSKPKPALSPKQLAFVDAYLELGYNAGRAALAAGYTGKQPYSAGHQLLRNTEIQKRIAAHLAESAMRADEVLARLADQARSTMANFIKVNAAGGVSLDLAAAEKAGKLHLIKKIKIGLEGTSIELYDAQAALVQLGRGHGLFVDREELTGKDGAPLEMVDAKARLLSKFAQRAASAGASSVPGESVT